MRDIVASFAWVSHGVAIGQRVDGQGIDSIRPSLEGDTTRGARVYLASCLRCHGASGEGAHVATLRGLYAPPLWGPRSYNVGAGMARLRVMAAFVRRNMPYDQPGTLSPQQSFDVAAYVNSKPRPDHRGKENDWPRGDAPTDLEYQTAAKKPR